jgi:hypothetical protein
MHTSNIHEITKKAAVSIALKSITGHLLCTIWYNISNIENGGLERVGIIKRATCSSNGFTSANPMPRKRKPPLTEDAKANGGVLREVRRAPLLI